MQIISIKQTGIVNQFIITVANVNNPKESEQALKALNDKLAVRLIPIERVKIKTDPYFRLQGGKEVYISKGYCRINKKYESYAHNDVNKFKYLKKGTIVEVGFEF